MSKAKNKGKQAPGVQKRSSHISLVPGKSEVVWIIEPHDPLIVRDGRPFGPNPSARAISLSFPFPSTTTGGVRTRSGLRSDGTFDVSQIERVKQIKARGPLLVRLAQSGDNIEEWLVPAPADALLLEGDKKDHVWCKPLVPLTLYTGAEFNSMHDGASLLLVGPVHPDLNKPAKEAPPYWRWDAFEQWLLNPVEDELSLTILGHDGPLHEHRLHVSMNPETLTAKTGALFETSGLEFASPGEDLDTRLSKAHRLALAVVVDRREAATLRSGLAGLGAERRMVSWRRSDRDLPECPPGLLAKIVEDRACRVLLLTPACFEQGYRPRWLVKARDGVQPGLKAIAIQRPQVVSGWRLEPPPGPKPTRRLAPAGTVFFLSLTGEDDKALERWVKSLWMQCISDDVQDRNDGFGMAVLGSWSGKAEKMEEVKER
jgi:CRISPR-associated protein Cmr3